MLFNLTGGYWCARRARCRQGCTERVQEGHALVPHHRSAGPEEGSVIFFNYGGARSEEASYACFQVACSDRLGAMHVDPHNLQTTHLDIECGAHGDRLNLAVSFGALRHRRKASLKTMPLQENTSREVSPLMANHGDTLFQVSTYGLESCKRLPRFIRHPAAEG